MKIVHLAESMNVGGAETLISQLCRWQRQHGHDVSVHCLYHLGPLGEKLCAEGFEVIVHNSSRSGGRAASVYRELKRCRPDVVHCHNAVAAIVGAIPARMAEAASIVVTRHGSVAPPYDLRREMKFAFASRWCNWIVAVCEQARNNLMDAPFAAKDKVVCIYNAASPPNGNGIRLPAKSGFTLLHVARLNAAKDQATLLRAFAHAKTLVPDLQLWIVGDGGLRPKLERQTKQLDLRNCVTFFGEQAEVGPFYAAADAFVLSSVTEGVPISLLEAMAAGLPAVVTEVGGIAEVARRSGAIVTAPPSNAEALAGGILKLAQARSELPHLRALARQSYQAHFTLDRMAAEYMVLYNKVQRSRKAA